MPKSDNSIQANSYGISGGSLKYGLTAERVVPNITKGTSEWEGWGTALKPAHEPIVVARKPLSEKNVALNVLKWGTGGINIEACRIGYGNETDNRIGTDAKARGGKESLFGGYSNVKDKDIKMYKSQGRFPANLIHDGSDEVVGLFPDSKSTGGTNKISLDSPVNTGGGNAYTHFGDSGSAARFFYCAKASKSERNYGCDGLEEKQQWQKGGTGTGISARESVVNKNNHPTVKPVKLMEYLVRLVTRKGGIVLDPFLGSGTTAIACVKEGMKFIGIEQDEDYIKIAKARLKPYLEQTKLK